MRATPAVAGLLVLAVAFVILAVLYALGTVGWTANPADIHHYKHAAVALVLAVLCAVAANFARNRPVTG
jgi:hypothetical protein